jgi:hypothetical protein
MIGTSANHPNIDTVTLIPAREAIDNIDSVSGIQIVDGSFSVDSPNLRGT